MIHLRPTLALPRPIRPASLALLFTCVAFFVGGAVADSVRDFGAVGDGIADDTDAVRRAIAETESGLVEFPRGDYRITETIEIELAEQGPISLDGRGGAGRVTMAGPGPAFRFRGTHQGTANPAGFSDVTWKRERMPQIRSLEIVGEHPQADGVEFVRVMQPTLHGVLIRQVRHGVVLSTRNRNVLIDACHIYECSGIGVFFDRVNLHQAIIQGSHISYCKRGGIKIVDGEIRNFQITGNDIEYNYDREQDESADIWFELRDGTVAEGTISGNTIQAQPSPNGANIRFVGPEDHPHRTPMSMWTISGNLIGSQEVNLHLVRCRGMAITGNHIYSGQHRTMILDQCRHIVVGANSLDQSHNEGRGMTNGVTVRDSRGITLSGLVLDQCAAGDAERGAAVEVFDSAEVIVADCQILDPHVRGLWASGTRNLIVRGNLITEHADAARMLAPIEIRDVAGTTVVRDNLIRPGRIGDVLFDPGSVIARGNDRVDD